jgi:transcriptional regulator of acetoin/glycerol metabolism
MERGTALAHTPRVLVLAQPDGRAEDVAADLADPLGTRWARVAALGLRRDGDGYPTGGGDSQLTARRARLEHVFREEHDVLAPMASELAARSFCAIVADADGVILSAHDGGAFDEPAARDRLDAGADWSERARGTNAIGTAIVERAPVAVLGLAHYEHRNGSLFCYAAPVFDARGDLVAVIDVSGPMDRHDAGVGVAVGTAAAAVERALRAVAFARAGVGNLAALERLVLRAATPALLVEPRGPVRLRNEAARLALGPRADAIDCEGLFGVDFAALAAMAREGHDARFETRDATFRVELDPLLDPEDRPLGVVVHLAPVERPAPSKTLRASTSSRPPEPSAAPLPPAFDAIFASDAAVVAAKRAAATFAATDLPVLLLAETGTGKELFARAIHDASPRARGPFVAVNCGALSPALLESELFGYAPGAFTGAARVGSTGLLGAADGGTLFLDEIAEMPGSLQAALLRALDDGSYRRLGDPRPVRASFRLVGATCRDLAAMVESGAFRRDLFYRIHGACIRIPPLRTRNDRVELARALLAAQRTPTPELTPSAAAHIETHDWPGNVRELKNAVLHALALAGVEAIEAEHFPAPLVGGPARPAPQSRDTILQEAAEDAVRAAGGNVSAAARRLGVARDTVYRMLRRK